MLVVGEGQEQSDGGLEISFVGSLIGVLELGFYLINAR